MKKRIVLDSNYFRGAPIQVLRALAARGFRISVSVLALHEVWANAVVTENLGLIYGRARALADLVDAEHPIAPVGVELIARLGGRTHSPEFVQPTWGYADKMRTIWTGLCARRFDEAAVRGAGLATNNQIDEIAQGWLESCLEAAELREEIRRVPEHDAVVRLGASLAETCSRGIALHLGVQERWHGYYRTAALYAVRAALGSYRQPEANDSEDLQLLMHLGDDVVLATFDKGLIQYVDAAGSFQAPWVRTLGELMQGLAPAGPPWGRSARRAAKTHVSRDRRALRGLEDQARIIASG